MMSNWEIRKLGDIVAFRSGGTPPKANLSYWEGDIPWISAATMHKQEIHTSNLFISEQGLKSGSKLAKAGELLLLVRGSMLWKKIPICICKKDVAFNQDVKAIRPHKSLMPEFLLYWFLAHEQYLLHKVVGTGIGAGKLDFDEIKSLQISVPSIDEQSTITSTLQTWDTAIEKTEALIAAKEQQFKWLLKRLINDQIDNPAWQKVKLGDVFKLGRGRVISKKEIQDNQGIFPVYSSQTSNNGKLGNISTYDFEGDYITWTTDGANAGTVFYRTGKFNCTNVCGTAKPVDTDKVNCQFISYFLQGKTKRHVSYVGNPKLMNNVFSRIPIMLAPPPQQEYIAKTLNTIKHEISLLEALTEKYRTQKRGLMQKLLTGVWRIQTNTTGH